ncbi:MAG: hypothetical protein IH594_02815 [Bacteroidales bacterium]|nr:hypothetical protein [Bacteroidales bacterium]
MSLLVYAFMGDALSLPKRCAEPVEECFRLEIAQGSEQRVAPNAGLEGIVSE